jgi:hypothetical protein
MTWQWSRTAVCYVCGTATAPDPVGRTALCPTCTTIVIAVTAEGARPYNYNSPKNARAAQRMVTPALPRGNTRGAGVTMRQALAGAWSVFTAAGCRTLLSLGRRRAEGT